MSGLGDMEEVSYTGISVGVLDSLGGGEPTEGMRPGEDSTASPVSEKRLSRRKTYDLM